MQEQTQDSRQAGIEKPADRRYFDNTTLKDYKTCPRSYFLRHMLGWRRQGTSLPLVFGLSWHACQDVIWQHYRSSTLLELVELAQAAFDQMWVEQGMPEPSEMDITDLERYGQRTPMIAKEMIHAYVDAKAHILGNCEVVAIEQPFAVPLPVGSADGPTPWYAGRLDKVVDYAGKRLVIEHKTTTEYKIDGGFKQNYLEGWFLDSQVMGYLYGGGLFFEGLGQVWIDAALVHKKARAFKFIPVSHQWSMLEHWLKDTQEWVQRIYFDERAYHARGDLGGGVFPKNSESCMSKYGACQFLNICRATPDPSQLDGPPDGFVEETWSPFDILQLHKLVQGDNSGKATS